MLALVMMLTLGACGGAKEKPAEGGEEATQSETTETESTEASESGGSAVDLAALSSQLKSENNISDSVDLTSDAIVKGYGVSADQIKSAAGFSASSGAAFPEEIVMVEAVDETAAADVKTKMDEHLKSIADQAASYDPDSLELAENCTVVQDGVYVGMFFTQNYDAMVSSFQNALG